MTFSKPTVTVSYIRRVLFVCGEDEWGVVKIHCKDVEVLNVVLVYLTKKKNVTFIFVLSDSVCENCPEKIFIWGLHLYWIIRGHCHDIEVLNVLLALLTKKKNVTFR